MGAVSGFFNNREIYEPSKAEIDRIKEETYYLVKFNYSINVNGFALLNDIDKEFFDSLKPSEDEHFYLLVSISESDKIEFTDYEKWNSCYTWEAISDEDRCTINVLIGSRCGYFFYPEIEGE